ncbi:MAG: class I SAM-dependent methyltransferase [Coriobacteriia bacterium]|nr:class I SAM-dependent methyltransferase [Coriobacteriia bacterium]
MREQYERWLRGWTPVSLYVRWYLRHGGARYAPPLFAAMRRVELPRVLDVGCATGFYLLWAFEHGLGAEILAGIDVSPQLLSEAARRLEDATRAGANVELLEASATALPFADGSFDAVLCNGVVKYLDDAALSEFLREARRVLAPGGCIAVADFGRPIAIQTTLFPPKRFGIPTDHLRTADELRSALTGHGFVGVRDVPLKRLRRIPLTYEGAVGVRA